MFGKKKLIEENKRLNDIINRLEYEKMELKHRLDRPVNADDTNLNLKYLGLISKYNKLMDSCLSSETEHITYNGELYGIQTIDYHKDTESVDTIDIRAVHIPREKGLINNLAEPFKNVAKELNKLFFGNENI